MLPFFNKKENMTEEYKTIDFLKRLVNKNNLSFEQYAVEQFTDINAMQDCRLDQQEYQWKSALENDRLNRYCNILPFDKNRVKLADGGYINASHIQTPTGTSYIAAQGPLRHTMIDFWRMIIEQKVPVIVCLTPEIEKGMEKCARYWPEGDQNEILRNNDGVMVELQNVEKEKVYKKADCMVRRISVALYRQNESVQKTEVVQLQFFGWPDHGVPNKPDKVLALVKLARTFYKEGRPAVVHCSAGCGRTGTFCVIDTTEAMIKNRLGPLDPVSFLTDEFRKQRTTMVQTPSQFIFCYVAVLQFLKETKQL
ncbi:hypothetical protein G6F38_009953 [Rhizopus arrhizus]|nr:hypothetical protein G6F38_009953 [Rhizopus arrhizus]